MSNINILAKEIAENVAVGGEKLNIADSNV